MCSSRKYCYPTPQRGLEFPGGGGFSKTKTFKEMYEAYNNNYWTFEGGGGLTKDLFPRGGGMDIFWNYKKQLCQASVVNLLSCYLAKRCTAQRFLVTIL